MFIEHKIRKQTGWQLFKVKTSTLFFKCGISERFQTFFCPFFLSHFITANMTNKIQQCFPSTESRAIVGEFPKGSETVLTIYRKVWNDIFKPEMVMSLSSLQEPSAVFLLHVCNVLTETKKGAGCVLFYTVLCQLVAQAIAFLKKEQFEGKPDNSKKKKCFFWAQPLITAVLWITVKNANKAVSAKYSQALYYRWNLKKKKLRDIIRCCVYITLTLKERSSVWRTHFLFWKQLRCHGSHCISTLQDKRNQWSQSVFAQPTRSQCLSSTKIWAHI